METVKRNIEIIRALGDVSRYRIMEMFFRGKKPVEVGDMIMKLKIEPTLLSHHLRILKDKSLLQSERVGKKVIYSLKPPVTVKNGQLRIDNIRIKI